MLVKKIIRNISNAFRIKKILQIMFFDIIRHSSRQKSVGNLFIFNIFYFNYWLIAIIRFLPIKYRTSVRSKNASQLRISFKKASS